jgi:hypothetical protein
MVAHGRHEGITILCRLFGQWVGWRGCASSLRPEKACGRPQPPKITVAHGRH